MIFLVPGSNLGPRRHHGLPLLLESLRLRDDPGPVAGDQPKASGCAGGHAVEKYHLEGE